MTTSLFLILAFFGVIFFVPLAIAGISARPERLGLRWPRFPLYDLGRPRDLSAADAPRRRLGPHERLNGDRPRSPASPTISKHPVMIRPDMPRPASIHFKVFVKENDGRWRVASAHPTRSEAERVADQLALREGYVARVML